MMAGMMEGPSLPPRGAMTTEGDATGEASADVLVLGGGVSGLSAAWGLMRAGLRVTLLEARNRPGGVIRSRRDGGWLEEAGPNTLAVSPQLHAVLRDLGLDGAVLLSDPQAARRYVVSGGRLEALPRGPLGLFGSALLRPALPRLLREPWVARGVDPDESVAEFAARRLGPHVRDLLVDPFVSGVYAGDPSRLSIRAAFPRLHALEAEHGSLLRGGLSAARRRRKDGPRLPPGWRGRLLSFADGLQVLTDRIAERLRDGGATLLCGVEAAEVARDGAGWQVRDRTGRVWRAAHLILATPAHVGAGLLRQLDAEAAALLDAVPYAPMAVVTLGFGPGAGGRPLGGFGMLLPRIEGRPTLGALFSSSLFEGRAPAGHKLITAFIGGRRNPSAPDLDDETLLGLVSKDLADLLGLDAPPLRWNLRRWPAAIPQYEIGHLERLDRLDSRLAALPGLYLTGNWRGGIGVVDCLNNGLSLAGRIETAIRASA